LKKKLNNNENVIVIFADLLILYARIVIKHLKSIFGSL